MKETWKAVSPRRGSLKETWKVPNPRRGSLKETRKAPNPRRGSLKEAWKAENRKGVLEDTWNAIILEHFGPKADKMLQMISFAIILNHFLSDGIL